MKAPSRSSRMFCLKSLFGAGVLLSNYVGAVSWDYAELSYLADGKSHFIEDDRPVHMKGLTLDAAFSVHDHVHVRGISRAWNSRVPLPPPNGYADVAANEWHSLGVGANYPMSLSGVELSGWAELSLDYHGLHSIVGTGYGYALGVRSRWQDAYEFGIWYRAASTDLSGLTQARIEPSAYGLDFLYSLSDSLALRLGWSNGDLTLKSPGDNQTFTVTSTELGLRYLFDVGSKQAHGEVLPLGYNHVHVAYAVSGGLKAHPQNMDWSLEEGVSLGFRVAPREYVFFGARYDGRAFDTKGAFVVDPVAPANHMAVGPGGYYTVYKGEFSYSGYAQLTYNRVAAMEGLVLQGHGATLGVRAAYKSLLEAHLFRIDARASEKLPGGVSRLDPEGVGMEVAVLPFDNGLAFTLGYEEMKFSGRFLGSPMRIKTDQWLLGLRQQF